MPTPDQYTKVARTLKEKIKAAYISIPYSDIQKALNQIGVKRVTSHMRVEFGRHAP